MKNNLSGKFVGYIRKKKLTARTAEELLKIQSKITYGKYKQHGTEEFGGDSITI